MPGTGTSTQQELTTTTETSPVLSGVTDPFLDGTSHFGVAVTVSSGSGLSTLMIPDATKKEPIFVTKPVQILGSNLKTFLTKKGITLPDPIARLVDDAAITCDAFYYSKDVVLMMFALKFDKGLISSLTGDPDVGALFDLKGASVRIIKCPKASFDLLQKYVAGLSA